ncbi:MAG TPA: polymer-forming cytoskeletal protein [Candidatus Tumulicola sp.]|jgi:hypothetical protein
MRRPTSLFVLLAVLFVCSAGAAKADVPGIYHGGAYVGSVAVGPDQTVKGDLTVFFGDVTIEGVVDGNVNVIGGNVYARPGAIVTGQVHTIGGDVVSAIVPWSPDPERVSGVANFRLLWHVASGLLVLLFFLIFPVRSRIALDRLERHPGLCCAVGLLGWVAVLPIAVLLICTIILIPLVPLEAVAVIGAIFLGKAALALLVGRRLCEQLKPNATPAPLLALVTGLVLVTAAELIPVVGVLVSAFVLLIGMGASILAFSGYPSAENAPVRVPKPPLSGPPMPVG